MENTILWRKELRNTLKDGKTYQIRGMAKLTLSKWLYYWKQSVNSLQSPFKFLCDCSKKQKKKNSSILQMETQKTPIVKSNCEPKRYAGGITMAFIKLYYRVSDKTEYYWIKIRHVEQWNSGPRNKPMQLKLPKSK
jgi:hypothetical protein